MQKPKGGRGKRAPYEQVMVRVPLPLKKVVQTAVNAYRTFALDGDALSVARLRDEVHETVMTVYEGKEKPVYGHSPLVAVLEKWEEQEKNAHPNSRDWKKARQLLAELRSAADE